MKILNSRRAEKKRVNKTPPEMIPKKTHPQRKRESMAKIIKRTKKDGSCSYCIRVSNGYDRLGRQVLVNRTYTPPPGLTGKKLA